MSIEPNPIILSFYQAVLLPVVNDVNKKWDAGDYVGAFNSIRMEYAWLPPECKKEVKEAYDKARRDISQIKSSARDMDISSRRTKIAITTKEYIYDVVLTLSELFHDSLDAHHYLEKQGIRPKYQEKAKL